MARTACTMGVSMRAITSRGSTIRLLSPPSLPALPLRLRVLSPSPAFQELLLLPAMIKKYIKKLSATHTCMCNANTCAHIPTPGSQRISALKFPIFWQTFLVSSLHHSLQSVACSLGSWSSGKEEDKTSDGQLSNTGFVLCQEQDKISDGQLSNTGFVLCQE